MSISENFVVTDIPAPAPSVLTEFGQLPLDPYTGGRQRYRRFSQFRLSYNDNSGSWVLMRLPHRPFVQPRAVNGLVGGVKREFEPLRIDPSPQLYAGAEAYGIAKDVDWQVNVHQCRVITTPDIHGVSVPEGPHRDGHEIGMLAVFARHNITGGENQLMPTGGGEPFFRVTLQPNQALIYQDGAMWHHATDIVAADGGTGYRDLWIIAFNVWDDRKYGDTFEEAATTGDGTAAVPAVRS